MPPRVTLLRLVRQYLLSGFLQLGAGMTDRSVTSLPEIRCFPDRDPDFQADVQAAIARSLPRINEGQRLIEVVRRDLAARYPSIVIRERETLAEIGTHYEHWYIYRDGRA